MRIKLAIPDHLVTPEALEAALEATMLADEQAILHGEIPDVREAIAGGVKWKPEPYTDGEHFDLGHEVMRRRWGDCDDLAPWLGASLRASGEDDGARPRVYQSGPERWHVVTETSDGEILDPSRWAGMGKKSAPSNPGVGGAVARPFAHPSHGALCVMPHRGSWRARADLPFADADAHLASHGYGRTADRALDAAISGAMCCGDQIHSPALERLREAGTMLLGEAADMIGGSALTYDLNLFRKFLSRGSREGMTNPDVANYYISMPDSELNKAWTALGKAGREGVRAIAKHKGLSKGFASMAMGVMSLVPGMSMAEQGGAIEQGVATGNFSGALDAGASFAANAGVNPDLIDAGGSLLSTLTSAGRRSQIPGGTQAPGGGMSVPVSYGSRDSGCCNPMTLYYHPAGAIGPVVMRF